MGYGAINIVKSKEEGNKFNYFLVYFLFAFGGVTTFSSNSRFVQGFFILLAVIFFFKKAVIDKEFLIILFFVFIIYIVQGYVIDDITLKGALVLFYTFFIPYSIIKLVGKKFTDYYIRITYLFSIISFFFLIPSYYSQDFREAVRHFAIWINLDPLEGVTENFIIYNYESMTDGLIKNPGPFYEAGAFGTFLIIALLLNLIKTKNIFEKKNIIFVVTILSTLSTAAYISLFCLLFFYLMEKKSIWMNMVIAPIFVAIVFVTFSRVPFLKTKIVDQIESSSDQGEERVGRIQGGKVDLQEIRESPIFGKALGIPVERSNNGLTDMALSYGIIGFILFFFLITKSLKLYCQENMYNPRFAIFASIPLAAVLFGQVLYAKPIFLGIMMMFILYKQKDLNYL